MVTPNTQKIVVALVVLLILGFLGYKLFVTSPDTGTNSGTSTGGVASTTAVEGQDILTLVEKLKNISINQTIFSSNLFNNLTDFSIPISQELQGRTNPFAPIGSDMPSSAIVGNPKQATSTKGL